MRDKEMKSKMFYFWFVIFIINIFLLGFLLGAVSELVEASSKHIFRIYLSANFVGIILSGIMCLLDRKRREKRNE